MSQWNACHSCHPAKQKIKHELHLSTTHVQACFKNYLIFVGAAVPPLLGPWKIVSCTVDILKYSSTRRYSIIYIKKKHIQTTTTVQHCWIHANVKNNKRECTKWSAWKYLALVWNLRFLKSLLLWVLQNADNIRQTFYGKGTVLY